MKVEFLTNINDYHIENLSSKLAFALKERLDNDVFREKIKLVRTMSIKEINFIESQRSWHLS